MGIITVKNLYKIFGNRKDKAFEMLDKEASKEEILDKTGCTVAINNASFDIQEQEIFVIMGLSGSGKSTVLRCLNRLIEPTKGEVLINGKDILKVDKEELLQLRRSEMSMVFQHFGLFPHRTVSSNVEYGLEIGGMEKPKRKELAYQALGRVGLKGYEESMPDELSGGMQQRVGLARALANDPKVLLMDEAFSALDPLIRAQMQDELLDLQAEMHKTIVFITHDLDEALKLGDRIAIMKDGMIVQIGTPEEILTEPSGDYVRSFVQNVDRTKVITASSIMRKPPTIIVPKDGPKVAARKMEKVGVSTLYVIDKDRKLIGIVRIDDVIKLQKGNSKDLESIIIKDVTLTAPDTPLSDLLAPALMNQWPIAVLDEKGTLVGIVDRASIIAEVGDNYGTDTTSINTLDDLSNNLESTTETE
ncbi:MAG TPA: glycine betaine/L-proline ABC transporter ATP-binding protein [Balneolales bacterium]|nr:glycine betaine/L-proline ABC transporter ATP-binding protein [Balneolales bacterium]